MGKITRQRTRPRGRANVKTQQARTSQNEDLHSIMEVRTNEGPEPEFKVPEPCKTMDNPFGSTKIDVSALRTRLTTADDEEDRMSFISKGSISKGKEQMKKKDKMKLRRERWLEKVEKIQQSKTRRREKMKRLKTPVVGDLEPMMSALPELSEIIQMSREAGKRANKRPALGRQSKKSTLKTKQRQKLLNEEKERFQKVLEHAAFQANPFGTINRHLSLKIHQENESGES